MMEKVIALLFKTKKVVFDRLQELIIYFLFVVAVVACLLAIFEFKTSLDGGLCIIVALVCILLAIRISKIE